MARIIILEHHPMDCRIKIAQDQNHIQTLSERMGTGGGNVPLVAEPIVLESNQNHATITQTGICSTLPASMGVGGGYTPMIVEVTDTVIPIEGNGARPSHFGNGYRDSGAMYSLNTTEVHAVAYVSNATQTFPKNQSKTSSIIAVLGGGREHSTICMDGTAPTLCTFQDSKPILIARVDNAEIL